MSPPLDRWPVYVILLEAILGVSVILYATRWGPWAQSDSAAYILSARNLLDGYGLGQLRASGRFVPTSGHPPLYSLFLSLGGLGGLDLISVARGLDVLLFGLTIFFAGWGLYTLTRSSLLAIVVSTLLLTSPIFLNHYSGAMSEPLFFTFGLASILLTTAFMQRGGRHLLILAAVAAGLAFLARYSGLAFVLACAGGLIINGRIGWKQRVTNLGVFAAISLLPMLVWLGYLSSQSGAPSPRQFAIPTDNLWHATQTLRGILVDSLWGWIPFSTQLPEISYRSKLAVIAMAAIPLAIPFGLLKLRPGNRENQKGSAERHLRIGGMFALFSLSYVLVLAFTVTFTQNPPDIDDRVVSPLALGALLAFFSITFGFVRIWPSSRLLQAIPLLAAVVFLIDAFPPSIEYVSELHAAGRGYTSRRWQTSGTLEVLREIPEEVPIITNQSAAVALLTNRPAYDIPELIRGERLPIHARFGDDLQDETHRIFREGGAALVLFDSVFWQMQRIYGENTAQRLEAFTQGLRLYSSPWDGAIYYYGPRIP